MSAVGVARLKAGLSGYLKRVKAGEEILVTEHGKPVARVVPIDRHGGPTESDLIEMERAGIVRLGTGSLPPDFWDNMPEDPDGITLAHVLAERQESW